MAKAPITPDQLQVHLTRQLRFLDHSAEAFDNGFEDEAVRLAVTIRTLVHDTKHSRSLLGLLDRKTGTFVDSAEPLKLGNLSAHGGLVAQFIPNDGTFPSFIANLDETPEAPRDVDFDTWWIMPVFTDGSGRSLSRKDIVLVAANQDGGAHVDPALDEEYRQLQEGEFYGWVVTTSDQDPGKPMKGPERAAIRQIAHEMLKSLRPGYTKKVERPDGMIFMGVSVEEVDPSAVPPSQLSSLSHGTGTVHRENKPRRLFRP